MCLGLSPGVSAPGWHWTTGSWFLCEFLEPGRGQCPHPCRVLSQRSGISTVCPRGEKLWTTEGHLVGDIYG